MEPVGAVGEDCAMGPEGEARATKETPEALKPVFDPQPVR